MKITAAVLSLSLLLFTSSCAVPQPKFEPTLFSTRRSLLRGEIKEALASYEAQAQAAERNAAVSWFPHEYWRSATAAYTEASRAARITGNLHKAITYGEKAFEMAEKGRDPGLWLQATEQLIIVHGSLKNFDKRTALIDKGFVVVKQLPPNTYARVVWEANLHEKLGVDLLDRGEYEKAIDAFSQSVYLSGDRLSRAYTMRRADTIETSRNTLLFRVTMLGLAYRRSGKLQEALEQYQRAFTSIEEWELKYAYEDRLHLNMGEIYRQKGNFPHAVESFKKALILAESQQNAGSIVLVNRRIGDLLRQTGKPIEAVSHFQKAVQQIESTRSLLQSEDFRRSFFEGGLDAYVSMIGVLSESDKPEEAFAYSERARSRAFLDVLGSKVQLSKAKSGLLEEERALQGRIASIKARLASEEDGETDRAGLRRELTEAEKAYNDFLSRVRKQDKEQASLMTVEPLTLKQVQELLDPGTSLVEYFVTGQDIFIWVVEKEKLEFQRVPLLKEDLAKLVKALRERIFALGEKSKFNEVSSSLYKQLIQPVLPHITGKELIIVPHDVLHYLPFHALQSPDGRYLIERYPIYYLSSASLLQFTKEKRKAKGEKVLALGNPDLGDPQMSLRFAELEAKEVRALYPQSTILLKKEATEEKAKALSPQHDILHFASHAELSEEDPLSSAILLTKDEKEDGRLEVREIFGMDLKANLVVLSACETGLGKLSSGDELVGLTRAFIYAGTPSVVASLWKVEDSSTAQLMASFYKNLRTMSKVEALRQAQLELIRGQSSSDLLARRGIGGIGKLGEVPEVKSQSPSAVTVSTSHPYFWAPFILVGDGK